MNEFDSFDLGFLVRIRRSKEAVRSCFTAYEERRGDGEVCALRVPAGKMTEVILHVYDVTNSGSEKSNNTIMQINRIFKDTMGLGGIFHSAVQVSLGASSLSVDLVLRMHASRRFRGFRFEKLVLCC